MGESKICRVALVGAGYTAKEHAKAFSAEPGAKLAGIFSRTAARARNLADDMGIEVVCSSMRELYEKTRADLLVVTVNEPAMKATAEEALQFPWAVLLEKPPGLDLAQAEAIRKAAQDNGREVRVAMNRQSFGATRAVCRQLAGHQGRRFVKVQDQENPQAARQGGASESVVKNWMFANSIHLVDYFRLFARGKAVHVTPVLSWDPLSAPCVVASCITFDSGDVGLYEAVWNGPGPWAVSITVPGRRWEIRPLEKAVTQVLDQRPEPLDADPWDSEFKPGFRYQAQEAVALAQGGSCTLATMDDALKTMRLIAAIYGQ